MMKIFAIVALLATVANAGELLGLHAPVSYSPYQYNYGNLGLVGGLRAPIYGGFSAPAYSALSAPAYGALSAPVISKQIAYAQPVVPQYTSYSSVVSHAAPVVQKTIAAPALSYAAPALSYAAPTLSYAAPVATIQKTIAAPTYSYTPVASYQKTIAAAPLNYGYPYGGFGTYGAPLTKFVY